jgi:N-dimethylarginine dimethylaminohydrolase
MSATLRRVALRRPDALLRADHHRWHYRRPVRVEATARQHAEFTDALVAAGVQVDWLDGDDDDDDPTDDLADSVFTYDPSFVVPAGAILLRPGKSLRMPEVELHERFYRRVGIPIIGHIAAPATIEGGDILWLDDSTLAVGRGTRTNRAGIDQLRTLLEPHEISVLEVDLPVADDPAACLHLLSIVNPVDHDLALVRRPLVPPVLVDAMIERGYELLDAPAAEFDASFGLSLNVLALAPRQCLAIDGFPETHAMLRAAGCTVTVFAGDALCVNCEGGPTCLTRPLLRS